MKRLWFAFVVLGSVFALPATAAPPTEGVLIRFPRATADTLGPVDKLVIAVTCGSISGLADVPALYDVEIEYDISTRVTLEARPRLGAAAVGLMQWSSVVKVRPADGGCFRVDVSAEGRSGVAHWTGKDLGLAK